MSASAANDTTDVAPDGTKSTKNSLTTLVDSMNANMMKLMDTQAQGHQQLILALTRPKTATLSSGKQVRIE